MELKIIFEPWSCTTLVVTWQRIVTLASMDPDLSSRRSKKYVLLTWRLLLSRLILVLEHWILTLGERQESRAGDLKIESARTL